MFNDTCKCIMIDRPLNFYSSTTRRKSGTCTFLKKRKAFPLIYQIKIEILDYHFTMLHIVLTYTRKLTIR